MQQDRRHFAEETGEVTLPSETVLETRSPQSVSSAQAQDGKTQGESRDFISTDESFHDFFTTTIAVLPKGMKNANEKQAADQAAQTGKESFAARCLARLRGMFATDAEEEEDDLLGENLFFPEQTTKGAPEPITKKAAESQQGSAGAAQTVETLQFDLFAGEAAPTAPQQTSSSVAKPKGKVRFVTETVQTVEKKELTEPELQKTEVQPLKSVLQEPVKEQVTAYEQSVSASEPMAMPQTADPTDALVASLLREGRETVSVQPIVQIPIVDAAKTIEKTEKSEPVEPWSVDSDMPEESAQELLGDEVFQDLSEETAFLREECAQRTTRRETVFTKVTDKFSSWKETLVAARAARQQSAAQDSVAQDVTDQPMTQEEFFASFTDGQGADATAAKPTAQQDATLDLPMLVEPEPAQAASESDTSEVTTAREPIEPIESVKLMKTGELAQEAAAAKPAERARAEEEPFDMMLTTVQDAFAQRTHQTATSAAQDEAAVPAQPAHSVAEPLPEESCGAQNVQELLVEEVMQAQAVVETKSVQEEPVVDELTQAEPLEIDLSVPENAPEVTAVEEVTATEKVTVTEEESTPIHRDYCLFDQDADDQAADEQIGEITFAGASAGTVSHVTMGTSASPAAPANDFFAVLEDEFPEDEEHPTAQGLPASQQTEAQVLDSLGFAADKSSAESPFEMHHPRAPKVAEQEPLPQDPEGIEFGLSGMRMRLLIRTFTTAIFAIALFMLGLMGQGVLAPVAAIDPLSAPVPFLLVNLLLLLAAAGVSYPVFIDGVTGLWRKPSPDTIPALATIAALLQLLLCLTLAEEFDPMTTTLFAGLAALALFADAFGGLVMAWVIRNNFTLCTAGVPHYLSYRVTAKDTLRTLAKGVEVDSPALLVSRPVGQIESFLEKSFSPRASDRRAQWTAYGLLGAAALAYLIALVAGQGFIGCISSFTAVLCIGAPLSATLISALPSVCLQRAAAKVGAVVPGWQSMEALGDINLLAVEAKELFPPLCAQLHGIKTFQKERVDLAILYATSILMEGCDTLQSLFAGMIEYKKEMLYPVKDLVVRQGEGFIGWCENYRVILGTRALMEAEGVSLPLMDYENRYSKDGQRQVLYLAVSGQLYAMFLLGYRGEKGIARALRTLRKEQIRLLVHTTDPTLTAERIEQAYHLPKGYITLLSAKQGETLDGATDYRPQADGCMLHLGNFTSAVGGFKAASGAVQAEASASAIQLVWAGFSILLCLFLAITGGLAQVALAAILLYQVAWSVLSLGVVLTKKFE